MGDGAPLPIPTRREFFKDTAGIDIDDIDNEEE
jgi:hypothetical protein